MNPVFFRRGRGLGPLRNAFNWGRHSFDYLMNKN
jgi:hypothetical protein